MATFSFVIRVPSMFPLRKGSFKRRRGAGPFRGPALVCQETVRRARGPSGGIRCLEARPPDAPPITDG